MNPGMKLCKIVDPVNPLTPMARSPGRNEQGSRCEPVNRVPIHGSPNILINIPTSFNSFEALISELCHSIAPPSFLSGCWIVLCHVQEIAPVYSAACSNMEIGYYMKMGRQKNWTWRNMGWHTGTRLKPVS